MMKSRSRSIAIAKADETRAQRIVLIRASVIAIGALAALAALPSFWLF